MRNAKFYAAFADALAHDTEKEVVIEDGYSNGNHFQNQIRILVGDVEYCPITYTALRMSKGKDDYHMSEYGWAAARLPFHMDAPRRIANAADNAPRCSQQIRERLLVIAMKNMVAPHK